MNLTILKLRSGEEIACQVLEETESNIKVFQPMVFKTISSLDSTGRPFDVTTLQDWLMNTDEKNVLIPVDHIAFKSIPNEDTVKLYQMESYQFDKNELKSDVRKTIDEEFNNQAFASFLEELMNSSSSLVDEPPPSKRKSPKKAKRKSKNNYLPPDMTDENELDRHMIMMQMYIPAEAIMNLITAGVIKPQVLLDMIEEIKKRNRFTGDETNRKDFGDKFSDWNPDPNSNDYK